MFVGVTLLVIDLGIIFFIDLLRKNPIHNLERDIARDNIYNVCLASLIPIISLLIISTIVHFIARNRYKLHESEQVDFTSKSTNSHDPTLKKTSVGRSTGKPVKISDNFDKLFLPFFKNNDQLKRNGCIVLKEQLKTRNWTKTELGRIANMIFEAKILVSEHQTEYTAWLPVFLKALDREADIPNKINKNAYCVDNKCELKKHFSLLVEIGEKRNNSFHHNISK